MTDPQRRFVDLHTHSTASDGSLSPEELIDQADRADLAAVALTDHDTIAGLAPAAAAATARPKLRFIGGVELSAMFPGGNMHILGLGLDRHSDGVADLARQIRVGRNDRNPRMLARLRELGMAVTMADVLAAAGKADSDDGDRVVGRVHIAETLRRKGYVRSTQEAFDRLIGDGGAAYVPKERFEAAPIIATLRDAGAVPVLAHPVELHRDLPEVARIVRELIPYGLAGIEAYHTDQDGRLTRRYLDLARELGLAVTGGSDFHGAVKPRAALGRPRVPLSALDGPVAELLGL